MVELNIGIVETIVFTFGFLIGAIIVSEIFLLILDKIIKPLTSKTKTTLDDRLIDAVKTPVRFLGILIGIYLTIKPLYPNYILFGHDFDFWLVTLLILWTAMLISNLANAMLKWYLYELSEDSHVKSKIKITQDMLPTIRKFVSIIIYTVSLTIVLNRLGIEITPLITALGIGGLAVALALKDTLSNFFASIYLITDKPIKIGEYIALDNENSTIRGFVEEIGWRTTRIRTRGNYIYFIPNEKITLSNIVNFSRGEGNWKGASITLAVPHGTNVEKTRALLLKAVEKTQKKSKLFEKSTAPFVQIEDLNKNGITFKIYYRINSHQETEAAASEVREQILEELRRNKIKLA
ncbi:MAG: mechanosensitive ion channel family protein [Candidatus Micrarchaeota archaeon]